MRTHHFTLISSSLAIISLLAPNILKAQKRFEIHTGITVPLGSFGKGNIPEEYIGDTGFGIAGKGINLGMQYTKQFSETGLGYFLSLDLYRNSLKREKRKSYELGLQPSNTVPLENTQFKHAVYYNIPCSSGLHFFKKTSDENLALFVNAGLSVNLLKISKYEHDYSYPYSTINGYIGDKEFYQKHTYKPTVSLGSVFDLGLVLKDKYTLGIRYTSLGKAKITTSRESITDTFSGMSGEEPYHFEKSKEYVTSKKIALFQLRVGMYL